MYTAIYLNPLALIFLLFAKLRYGRESVTNSPCSRALRVLIAEHDERISQMGIKNPDQKKKIDFFSLPTHIILKSAILESEPLQPAFESHHICQWLGDLTIDEIVGQIDDLQELQALV